MFGITSVVLYNQKSDAEFLSDSKPSEKDGEDKKKKEKTQKIVASRGDCYNTNVFEASIVYSTNSNFEGVFLNSLFRIESLRAFKVKKGKHNKMVERPYDIVIVDEVDNMLIDQQSSPSILSRQFPTKIL